MVLMSSEICATETPKVAGAIKVSTRRTPGCEKSNRQRGSSPSLNRNGAWKASCSTPPANTAQASTRIGGSKWSAKASAATMNDTLSSTGVIAGMEKRFQVLKMPAASATSEMNAMYGKQMRSIVTVRPNLAGSEAKPGADR